MGNQSTIHNPTNFVPENYDFQFCYSLELITTYNGVRIAHPSAEKARSLVNGTIGRCRHCGAKITYGAVMLHRPTGEYIVCGETCLENRFSATSAEFAALRMATKGERRAAKTFPAMKAWLAKQPEDVQSAFSLNGPFVDACHEGIVRQAWREYGQPTERQFSLVMHKIAWAQEQAAKAAQRAIEEQQCPKVPARAGKHTVTGEVLSIKTVESDYGTAVKMLLKVLEPNGYWKAWLTCPTAFDGQSGSTCTLTADFSVSNDDPSFAFGKRPRLAPLEAAKA